MLDWPSRIPLTVRPARQDAIYLRRMTTTALGRAIRDYENKAWGGGGRGMEGVERIGKNRLEDDCVRTLHREEMADV